MQQGRRPGWLRVAAWLRGPRCGVQQQNTAAAVQSGQSPRTPHPPTHPPACLHHSPLSSTLHPQFAYLDAPQSIGHGATISAPQ